MSTIWHGNTSRCIPRRHHLRPIEQALANPATAWLCINNTLYGVYYTYSLITDSEIGYKYTCIRGLSLARRAGRIAMRGFCRMLPMTLDLSRLRLALIGAGPAASQRLERLDMAGAAALTVYAPAASIALATLAGRRLVPRLPHADEFVGIQIVFIAGLPRAAAALIAAEARAAGAIVHVEDVPEQCDAQMPAVLRRGDLTIAVSTAGRSPGLAAEIRRALDRIIGSEWSARLNEISAQRERWRAAGLDSAAVRQWTADWLAACGWLAFDTDFESHYPSGAVNELAGRRVHQR
ncbi:MAG: hypothetical protein KGI92_05010 [Alphaproteobacteria bacterium]|nr:hypothetical protein [Alphaproteobacteria bacterium]